MNKRTGQEKQNSLIKYFKKLYSNLSLKQYPILALSAKHLPK